MGTAFIIFIILGILLLAQSAKSLRDGFSYLRYVRRCRAQGSGDYAPPAAVIIPVTGADAALETNIAAFMAQDYPQYQLVLVVSDERDPAFAMLNALVKEAGTRGSGRARSSFAGGGGAFACPGTESPQPAAGSGSRNAGNGGSGFCGRGRPAGLLWLRSLVAPLASRDVTVSTGFRWYLPGRSFVSQLRAAWDTSIATFMGEHDSSFPWGGSMAIRAEDFKRLEVRERYWASTVSDDYGLGRAVHDAGGRIRFEPRCLVASREDSTFAEFMSWTNRQMIITRVYAPRLWRWASRRMRSIP